MQTLTYALEETPEEVFVDGVDGDLDAELEALFANDLDLVAGARKNRAARRREAKSRTVFETNWQGRKLRWRPTQVPPPIRIARRRRRNKIARASRKLNR